MLNIEKIAIIIAGGGKPLKSRANQINFFGNILSAFAAPAQDWDVSAWIDGV